jgi:hypothetical protein
LAKSDCILEAELIAHLSEVEARRLHLEQGCSSMFDYCVNVLRFSEGVAYKRIGVARATRRFPDVGLAISRGEIHLSAASLIAPHLSAETVSEWLKAARHKTTREIKQLIADRFPREKFRTSVRRVSSRSENTERVLRNGSGQPEPRPATRSSSNPSQSIPYPSNRSRPATTDIHGPGLTAASTASALSAPTAPTEECRRGSTEALGAKRFAVRFTADEKVHTQLEELRSLLRHSVPDGDVGRIVARAIGALLEQVRKKKIGGCDSARSKGRMKPRVSAARSSRRRTSGARTSEETYSGSRTSAETYSGARTSEETYSGNSTKRISNAEPSSSQAKMPVKRNIPVAIRRAVWTRDDGRCTYRSETGRRCGSREAVEFHHQIPWARCKAHTVENIALRCRAHNQYEAELDFGAEHMARFRREAPRAGSRDEINLEEIPR